MRKTRITLKLVLTTIKRYFIKAYVCVRREYHKICVYYRYHRIKVNTDVTTADKFRTLAAKMDALEDYYDKYCNPDKVGRLECRRPQRHYIKIKNQLKKEALMLLYNY